MCIGALTSMSTLWVPLPRSLQLTHWPQETLSCKPPNIPSEDALSKACGMTSPWFLNSDLTSLLLDDVPAEQKCTHGKASIFVTPKSEPDSLKELRFVDVLTRRVIRNTRVTRSTHAETLQVAVTVCRGW